METSILNGERLSPDDFAGMKITRSFFAGWKAGMNPCWFLCSLCHFRQCKRKVPLRWRRNGTCRFELRGVAPRSKVDGRLDVKVVGVLGSKIFMAQ